MSLQKVRDFINNCVDQSLIDTDQTPIDDDLLNYLKYCFVCYEKSTRAIACSSCFNHICSICRINVKKCPTCRDAYRKTYSLSIVDGRIVLGRIFSAPAPIPDDDDNNDEKSESPYEQMRLRFAANLRNRTPNRVRIGDMERDVIISRPVIPPLMVPRPMIPRSTIRVPSARLSDPYIFGMERDEISSHPVARLPVAPVSMQRASDEEILQLIELLTDRIARFEAQSSNHMAELNR